MRCESLSKLTLDGQEVNKKLMLITVVTARGLILPAVLYECGMSFLSRWEEHSLGMYENRVQRRTLAPKWAEMMGVWKKVTMRSPVIRSLLHAELW
jgi:hypothetical protein